MDPRDEPEDDIRLRPAFDAAPLRSAEDSDGASVLVIGDGDELVVFLAATLVHQEIIVAAAAGTGVGAARGRTRRVNGAASLFGVEELADAAEVFIALAAHDVLVAVGGAREAALRGLEFQIKMLREAFDVTLVQGNDRIRTAVSRAIQTIVLSH
jgi:fumarate hydratase class II